MEDASSIQCCDTGTEAIEKSGPGFKLKGNHL
jgi:hypothetical protein